MAERNVGLTDNGARVCQTGTPPIISPKYQERITRLSAVAD
ncbi:hypothetical protein [Paenibacillus planticolens]|nr:hypothetical protein [Paenibacillus planticolens]